MQIDTPSAAPTSPPYAIRVALAPKLSFATHQSAVRVLRDLQVVNNSERPLEAVTLQVVAEPAVFAPRIWRFDQIAPGTSTEVHDCELALHAEFLLGLREAVRGSVSFRLLKQSEDGQEGELLAEQNCPVEVLSPNEWGGAGVMAELLAMFVQPNDPAVAQVLRAAAEVLHRGGRPDCLDGYESRTRTRSYELASAIWSAVSALQLTYTLPPASFELEGQKIRTPSEVLEQRLATCLDTAVLFAAALEQAGLNPVLVLTKGHALAGVWLQPQEFASLLTLDASTVRKRVALDELVVFETTFSTHRNAPAFREAVTEGKRQIAEEREQDFVFALDLRRARMQRIRPLAFLSSGKQDGALPKSDDALPGIEFDAAPPLPAFDLAEPRASATPEGRLERWQRKLLDLTARNRLLHAPLGKASIPLLCPDPGRLEDELADGKTFRIVAAPRLEGSIGRDAALHRERTGEALGSAYAAEAFERGEVLSPLDADKLEALLIELYRKSAADLAESGTNTLFLAVGFLNWRKTAGDTRLYRAPLILIPVKLDRRSVRSGVRLSLYEDEPRINLTLLEMLRQDFRLEIPELAGPLPSDGHGIDVRGIWTAMRKAVRDTPGFEVAEEVSLGSFSFAKYLMWKDLADRTEALKMHPVVRHLLETPREPYTHTSEPPRPEMLDRETVPADIFTLLPADSSQLAAVVGSARDCDFVLDGPPGTGKSQTIANMIAHNLALGRRVLFVAEKRAALDVVHRRLRAHGLGPFCLELHSNKANKKQVLAQFDTAWTCAEASPAEAWQREAAALKEERDRLNAYVEALHQVHPNGWTVYQAFGRSLSSGEPVVRFSWPAEVQHDEPTMAALKEAARRLGLQHDRVQALNAAAFRLVHASDWSNGWQAQVLASAQELAATARECRHAQSAFLEQLALMLPDNSTARKALADLADILLRAADLDLSFALEPEAQAMFDSAREAEASIGSYAEDAKIVSNVCPPESVRTLALDHLATQWENAKNAGWFDFGRKRRAVLKEFAAAGAPDLNLDEHLPRLRRMQVTETRVVALNRQLQGIPNWKGLDTNIAALKRTLSLASELRTLLPRLSTDGAQTTRVTEALRNLFGKHRDGNSAGPSTQAETYLREYRRLHAASSRFEELAQPPESVLNAGLSEVEADTAALAGNISGLNSWTAWMRARRDANALGLEPLVDALEAGKLAPGQVNAAFETAYARWWVEAAMDSSPALRSFNLAEHTDRISRFRDLDDSFAQLTERYIRAKLCGTIPSKTGNSLDSGFAILRHQLQISKRHKPIRQLMAEMGPAVAKLAPCVLMSPLSVAQYLPANASLFDLVIFDEASQITPWDAVGAIARGRRLILAGDPKQMPPTSFFDRGSAYDEEDSDIEEDQESILDECIGAALPRRRLTWHYRSLHESLIAFSNHRYYDGDLVTFPAPVTQASAVSLREVAGSWSRGKARTNQVEAEALAAEVLRRLTNPALRDKDDKPPSLAVITLNAEQQRLVEDLLDKARAERPELEPSFASESAEPVVVKNLETVQGDERDVVLLGVGYGPDTPGAPVMSMNFGPLNRTGGERRLNVAITRARREMVIFTSFNPRMIDLNRTSALALRDLKHFLEFAEQGPRALARAVAGSLGGYESVFEEAVAEGLRGRGWKLVPQVGVSRYRIDLGIVHPDRPGEYLAGVECDGAMYHSAATARDRDKVREAVLRQLGWDLVRVWSTDWWIDRRAALDRLEAALQGLLKEGKHADVAELDGYRVTSFEDQHSSISAAAFFDPGYTEQLSRMVAKVIRSEAPIRDEVLVARIARAHGFLRSGARIRERVLSLTGSQFCVRAEGDLTFVWLDAQAPALWTQARYPVDDESIRALEDIALPELTAALRLCSSENRLAETARRFGIKRLSAQAKSRLQAAL